MTTLEKSQALQHMERAEAQAATNGVAAAAVTISMLGDGLSANAVLDAIKAQAASVNAGDMRGVEAQLVASIATLEALFHRYIAKSEDAPSPRMQEMYAKMAFRAKGQAIRAAEALSGIKAGPLVIAKQVNMATGPQQVNNSHSPNLHDVEFDDGAQNDR